MKAIFKREAAAAYNSITGWLIAAFLLLFVGIYCMAYNLSGYTANFAYVLNAVSFIYLIAVPILSMRSLAEEKRQKTDQLLYSLPLRLSGVVLGKYLAMVLVLAVPLCIVASYPLILSMYGSVPMRQAYGALIGFFLLGICLLSVGLFISSVTESQVASAIITLVVLLLLYFMTPLTSFLPTDSRASLIALAITVIVIAALLQLLAKNLIVTCAVAITGMVGLYAWYAVDTLVFTGLFADIISTVSIFDRFDSFVEGVFDISSVVYYLLTTAVFLFLTVQSMEKRRWND